jgi:dipeptidyl aminopeptidase/acylaminoacyl peptidase
MTDATARRTSARTEASAVEAIRRMWRASLWLPLFFLGAPTPAAGTLPIEYFTRFDDHGDLAISPDGTSAVQPVFVDGVGYIAVYSLTPFQRVRLLRAGERLYVEEVHWASATRLIYRQLDVISYDWLADGELFGVDSDGGRAKALRNFGLIVSARADGDDDVLVRMSAGYRSKPQVARLDVYTGAAKIVEDLPLGNAVPVLDENETARVVTGDDHDGNYVLMWKPAAEWLPLTLAGFDPRSLVPQRYDAAAHNLVFIGSQGDAPVGLYRMDSGSGLMQQLYADAEVDVDRVVMDLADEAVIGVRTYADRPEYRWIQPEHPSVKVYQMLERAFPGETVSILGASRDQRRAIALVGSDVNPGDYYFVDVEARRVDYLTPRRSWVDPKLMRHKEPVTLKARDGLVLHAYLTRPRDAPGPFPTVVLPHDGPHYVRDTWDYDADAQLFAHHGYAVLQVNYRGSGGYGSAFTRAGVHEWGDKIPDDIVDATRWAIAGGIAGKGNICICGRGFGGYAALMAAAREPDLYRCVASDASFTDLAWLRSNSYLRYRVSGRSYFKEALDEDDEVLRKRSPVSQAGRIQAPVLLVYQDSDRRYSQDDAPARHMRDELEKAGKVVELVWLKDTGMERPYAEVVEFLARHLRGEPSP